MHRWVSETTDFEVCCCICRGIDRAMWAHMRIRFFSSFGIHLDRLGGGTMCAGQRDWQGAHPRYLTAFEWGFDENF